MKIEKNIPIPEPKKRGPKKGEGGRTPTYPFKEMEVGDSFIYSTKSTESMMRSAGCAARGWAKKVGLNWKFTVRRLDEGIRIWRIE